MSSATAEIPQGWRRVVVPVFVDNRGGAWAPGAVDLTLSHQGRTVLAESPPPGPRPGLERPLVEAALRLARAQGAPGVTCVAFAADPGGREQRFVGSARRLPAEHAVLERRTGVDLEALALHLARGGTLEPEPPEARGHALQVRLSARDPEAGFAPSSGPVDDLRLPAGPGLRADPEVEEGEVPAAADPGIARLSAYGRHRTEALARLQAALAGTAALVAGGATDKAFLAQLLDSAEVEAGTAGPAWLELLVMRGEHLPRKGAEVALLAAAIQGYETELDLAKARFYAAAARGRPEVPREAGRSVEVRYRGHDYLFRVGRLTSGLFRVETEGRCLEISISRPARSGRRLACGERSWRVSATAQGGDLLVEVDGVPHRIGRDGGGVVRAPAPAVVVGLAVQEGDEVEAGAPLAVLEAMKMETTLLAELPGRVRKVLVRKNAQVPAGGPLLVLEPAAGRREAPAGERVRFEPLDVRDGEGARPGCGEGLAEVRRLVLGYDADPRAAERLLTAAPADGDDLWAEIEILRAFADVAALFRRQPEAAQEGRLSAEEYLFTYLRDPGTRGAGLPAAFLDKLRRALAHYGVASLDRTAELEESLFRIAVSRHRLPQQVPLVLALLERALERGPRLASGARGEEMRTLLDRLIAETQGGEPAVHDLAREVRWRCFDRPLLLAGRERLHAAAEADLARLAAGPGPADRAALVRALVECPVPLHAQLSQRFATAPPALQQALLEVMVRRYYRSRHLGEVTVAGADGRSRASADYEHRGRRIRLHATFAQARQLETALAALAGPAGAARAEEREAVVELYLWDPAPPASEEEAAARVAAAVAAFPAGLRRATVAVAGPGEVRLFTFRPGGEAGEDAGGLAEDRLYRGLHPMMAERLELWRLGNFRLERLPAAEAIYLFHGRARENPNDERLFALAEVRDLTPLRDETGRVIELPQLEHTLMDALAGIRRFQARRPAGGRLHWNRVHLNVWPPVDLRPEELTGLVHRLAPLAEGLGLAKVAVRCRIPDRESGELRDWVLEISDPGASGAVLRFRKPSEAPLKPLRAYAQKVIELKRRGLPYPYEIVRMLAPPRQGTQSDLPAGEFVEHDLDAAGRLVPVHRPPGENQANVVAGVVRSFTDRYPEGMARVILLGDPSRGMGALAEPECRRIVAALDLAERMAVPLEWFAISGGARIALDSGTENMDWIARVLRRLVELTQRGGEVNLVVPGVNVGAQPYWNAEATMLMHTRGILVMTPEGAMVLTGKQALDYSGGVSAEDNLGIGGYERIMGPNGEAQYFARDLGEACRILLAHYEHAYVAPGERFPRPAPSRDPRDRDVCDFPHGGPFATVGEVFSDRTNPGRKKPFDIRRVMAAAADQDHPPLERWFGMQDAEVAVVWEAHLGGHPVCLVGFESRPLPRPGPVPADGPDQWTAGTLLPLSSKKLARAINAASGSRPLVVLANLSGFDGSPESMRLLQLEYGAEIGRAVVNFRGPIVFCVVSRYHGGAFVVFSNALHDNLEVAALEGTHASVIGGAPAAAVIFAREVDRRTRQDQRIAELEKEIADPERPDKARLQARLAELWEAVRSEKLGEMAEEFDQVHSVERARRVGSVDHILPPSRLRPYLIEAVERGMARELAKPAAAPELAGSPA